MTRVVGAQGEIAGKPNMAELPVWTDISRLRAEWRGLSSAQWLSEAQRQLAALTQSQTLASPEARLRRYVEAQSFVECTTLEFYRLNNGPNSGPYKKVAEDLLNAVERTQDSYLTKFETIPSVKAWRAKVGDDASCSFESWSGTNYVFCLSDSETQSNRPAFRISVDPSNDAFALLEG